MIFEIWYNSGMIKINLRAIHRYEEDLITFAKSAFPFATKSMVNTAAFETRRGYVEGAKNKLTLRNKWTTSSVRVLQATTLDVNSQEATVGSLASYAATTEFGGTTAGESGNLAIATNFSAGVGRGVRPRTKLTRKPNKMASIKLGRGKQPKTRKGRNAAAVLSGNTFVYLDLGRRKGIFKVTGKRTKKINMVHDLSRKSARVPATPILGPATAATRQRMPLIYKKALRFQLRRHRIFHV